MPLYGLMAEFDDPDRLVAASAKVRAEGYSRIEAYTPFPVHGLTDALEQTDSKVFYITAAAGIMGLITGIALQVFVSRFDYPINAGGRPYISWISFIPVTFECTVLFSAFGAVLGMLGLNGLPRPYHPVFNAPGFDRATQDRFFLCVEARDARFDRSQTERFLRDLGAMTVSEVPA